MADIGNTLDLDLERFGVPVSNKENKKLEALVKEKEKELSSCQINVDLHRERVEAIAGHLKNVKQELGHTLVRKIQNAACISSPQTYLHYLFFNILYIYIYIYIYFFFLTVASYIFEDFRVSLV